MTLAAELVDAIARDPAALDRLRAALELEPEVAVSLAPRGTGAERAAYTPATLAAELGRSPRSIRGAIARGELAAVKRGRGWIVSAEAVERWASATKQSPRPARTSRRRAPGAMRRGLGTGR